MISPAGVLQENRQAALDVIEKHEATIVECQHSIREHNEFIRSLDEAIEQLSGKPELVAKKADK